MAQLRHLRDCSDDDIGHGRGGRVTEPAVQTDQIQSAVCQHVASQLIAPRRVDDHSWRLGERIAGQRKETAPLALRANVEHNRVIHEHVVIMSIETMPVPRVADADRIVIDPLGYAGDGVIHVEAKFGYMETPNVPNALRLLDPKRTEGRIDLDTASYFLSKLELLKGAAPTMAAWRKRLFIATSYITADAAEYFSLPLEWTVIMGARVEV